MTAEKYGVESTAAEKGSGTCITVGVVAVVTVIGLALGIGLGLGLSKDNTCPVDGSSCKYVYLISVTVSRLAAVHCGPELLAFCWAVTLRTTCLK